MNLFLDIETIPTNREDVRQFIASTVSHPANIIKPETIAKWEAESKPTVIEEAIDKTGLDGAFGRVCVIGWAMDDADVSTVYSAEDERQVLRLFAQAIDMPHHHARDVCVIGHNIQSFDLRFLMQRYIVNGISPPIVLRLAAKSKPWDGAVYDTMTQWNPDRDKRVSLEKLCLALGVASPKSEITGATVWKAVKDGRIKEVADYCAMDVRAVRGVYRRMNFETV